MENVMVGFDKEAAEYILNSLREDGAELDYALMEQTLPLAMEGELAYLEKEGMLKDGELLEGEYDEDAAFEIMIEHVSRALPQADPHKLVDLLDLYIEKHDAYMEQKIPCRFVTDAQRAAQLNGRNAAFVRGTEIDRPEPGRQRQVRAVHDRPGRDGRLMSAGAALERVPSANRVIFRTAAFRADKTVRKPKPE